MQEETTNPDYKKPPMQIFVKDGDQTVFQFPILPPSISVAVEGKHNTINVQTRGDVTIIGKKGLKTVEFTSFFPDHTYPFAMFPKIIGPYWYCRKIEKMMEKPIRLTITDTNINMLCLIQSFSYGEPDSTGDIEFTISFLEYRPPKYAKAKLKATLKENTTTQKTVSNKTTTKKSAVKSSGIGSRDASAKTLASSKTYVVKKGDCLWSIAKKFYGDSSKHQKIYNANKTVIEKAAKKHGYTSSSNKGIKGWWIFPGTKLVITK